MPVKDKVVSWFIQNVIVPRREIIDQPGFVITTFTEQNQTTYLRDPFLSENLFELIENKIIEEYGLKGKKALYSSGKKFGYIYSSLSSFPTINTYSEKDFLEFAYYLVRYIEGTYSKQAKHEINLDKKQFEVDFKDYIICRHNGFGHIMTEGGISGIWAYAIEDKTVEGAQVECQGRGDNSCHLICAPEDVLKERTSDFFCERDLPGQAFNETYQTMNEIRPATYSNNSLKNLLDSGFFEYKKGKLTYKNIRFFHCESHILYLIEQELSKLPNGEKTLFDICFEYGKYVRKTYGETDYEQFISDYYPALGFGDITVLDKSVPTIASIYYPWTVFSEESKYTIFRGIMSGIASDSKGEKIEFNNYDVDIGEYLTLTISP